MTKSMSSASSIVVPSSFVMHFMNGAQLLVATRTAMISATVILPVTKI